MIHEWQATNILGKKQPELPLMDTTKQLFQLISEVINYLLNSNDLSI